MSEILNYVDGSKYSDSTIRTQKSIFKSVQKVNFNPYKITNSNINSLIIALKENNEKKYSDAYISTIISTLRIFNPTTLTKTATELGFKRRNKNNQLVIHSGAVIPAIKKMVTYCLEVLHDNFNPVLFSNYHEPVLLTKAEINTIIAVAIVTCTNIRISELMQLTVLNLYEIFGGQVIAIKFKKKFTSRTIEKMEPLFSNIYNLVLYAVGTILVMDQKLRETDFLQFVANPNDEIFSKQKLINTSQDTINKSLKQFYALVNEKKNEIALGLKIIRTLNTTTLLKYERPEVVAIFNRHNDPSTAFQYYNTPDTEGVMEALNL